MRAEIHTQKKQSDERYTRLTIDHLLKEFQKQEDYPHVVVDEIYDNVRKAVDKEINEIGDLMDEAVEEKKTVDELELTNLLYEKEKAIKMEARH